MDPVIVLSFIVLATGVVGSVMPALPGPMFSVTGLYVYWWGTGYSEPGVFLLISLTVLGLLAVVLDWLGPALASRFGGASSRTAILAGVAGILGLVFLGPLGLVLTVFVTALVLEYYRQRNLKKSIRAALAALLGAIGAPLLQLLMTGAILVSLLVAQFT